MVRNKQLYAIIHHLEVIIEAFNNIKGGKKNPFLNFSVKHVLYLPSQCSPWDNC